MRVVLAANAAYLPPRGGSTRSNLAWLQVLVARGHQCHVVCPALVPSSAAHGEQIDRELKDQQIRAWRLEGEDVAGESVYEWAGLRIHSVREPDRLRQVLERVIEKVEPDWVLVSSEDPGQVLLQQSLASAPGRVIYLAHTPQMFPFGPASLNASPRGAGLVARTTAVVAIGHHTARYIEQHLGRRPVVIHPPVYGPGPFQPRDPRQPGLILMINPCTVKGITIFLALARRFPHWRFGALPGWGTTRVDLRELEACPNMEILPNVPRIQQALEKARLLLVPSLWHEGFGLVVVEAMLMGIPVLASDQGGLIEAKLGTPYVLPVRPITRYAMEFDENRMPVAIVPEQDLEPWVRAIEELMSDQQLYEQQAKMAHERAVEFVQGIREDEFERFLMGLAPRLEGSAESRKIPEQPGELRSRLQALPPERRAALLERLRHRRLARDTDSQA